MKRSERDEGKRGRMQKHWKDAKRRNDGKKGSKRADKKGWEGRERGKGVALDYVATPHIQRFSKFEVQGSLTQT